MRPDDADRIEPDGLIELDGDTPVTSALAEPDEKVWWNTYSPRFEMPISFSGSALVLASFLGLLVLVLFIAYNIGGKPKGPTQIAMVDGDDESGLGTAGSGGNPDPIVTGESAPTAQDFANVLPNPDLTLPEVREELRKQIQLDDPNAQLPISSEKAAGLMALDEEIRKALLGQKKGAGGPNAEGDQGTGKGKGGTGADSTRARSLRWIMRFKTTSGRDYLNQLSAIGAEVIVPVPPDNKQAHLFKDLANPRPGTFVTEKDWGRLADKIQFSDYTRKSVLEVSEALNLDFTPKLFMAFFPRELEDRMSRLEKGHQNRRSEDIEETVFEVIARGGKPEIIVSSQKIKR